MVYINFKEQDIIEPMSALDILKHKQRKLTYDDYHYGDKTYTRYRTKCIEDADDYINEFTKGHTEYIMNTLEHVVIPNIRNIEKTTESFKIPKSSGGWRTITAPSGDYKEALSTVNKWLKDSFKNYTDQSYAYVPGRSILNAINRHKESNWFLKVDLHNFFGSITTDMLLEKMRVTYPFCNLKDGFYCFLEEVINFCTLDNVLPQGTQTSPILTNIFMTEFDCKMQKYVDKINKENNESVVYTRYADDILISSKKKETIDDVMFIPQINMLLSELNLSINPDKTRQGSIAGRNWNLGLMLNKDHKVTVGHKKAKIYKSIMYQILMRFKDGDTSLANEWQELNGKLNWFKQIEPEYFEYLVNKYQEKTGLNYYEVIRTLSI